MKFVLKEGYLGQCMGPCGGRNDATTEVFQKWDPPMEAVVLNGVVICEAVTGVRVHMCDECAKKATS